MTLQATPTSESPVPTLKALERAHAQHPETLTLLDLVAVVAEAASTEQEVVSTVTRLINSGKVTLVGHFRGADVRVE